jgi:putative membrane protein
MFNPPLSVFSLLHSRKFRTNQHNPFYSLSSHLTFPCRIGYNILISQIVLLYVYLLPFQLYGTLEWITIPGTVAAAYIILGLAAIGNELENPFGNDVNDLPLDQYCAELGNELDTLTSVPAPKFTQVLRGAGDRGTNKVLWPLSEGGYEQWSGRTEKDIRSALLAKVIVGKGSSGSIGGQTLGA